MTRRNTAAVALALLTAASVLTACGDDSSADAPTTTSRTTAASSSSADNQQVPTVSNPLDPTSLVSDPCAALSSSQLGELGFAGGETRPNEEFEGEACRWRGSEESLDSVDLTAFVGTTDGLKGVYASKDRSAYFEPTEVAGYPAVYSSVGDGRAMGMCGLWVGVSDQAVLHIMTNLVSAESAEASCGLAADVAEATISTLGG